MKILLMFAFLLYICIYIDFMLDKLTIQNLCREPSLDRETFASRPKKCVCKIMFVITLYYLHYTVRNHLSYVCYVCLGGLVLVALSWWPCLGGLVRQVEWVHPQPQLAKKLPKFLVYLLTIVAMLGEEEPTSQLG